MKTGSNSPDYWNSEQCIVKYAWIDGKCRQPCFRQYKNLKHITPEENSAFNIRLRDEWSEESRILKNKPT